MVWNPGTARLVASRSGWFPGPAQPLAGEEWLQVPLNSLLWSLSDCGISVSFQKFFLHSHCLNVQHVLSLRNGFKYKL